MKTMHGEAAGSVNYDDEFHVHPRPHLGIGGFAKIEEKECALIVGNDFSLHATSFLDPSAFDEEESFEEAKKEETTLKFREETSNQYFSIFI